MRRDTLELLTRVANALALQFGKNCEVVIHDLAGDDPENTIACIENGHVSRRDAKAGPSHIVLEAVRKGRRDLPDHYNYLTQTRDGRILRSSSVYIKDEDGTVSGIFCINYDLTDLMMAQSVVNAIVQTGGIGSEPEHIPTNVNELLDELLEQSVRIIGKPVAMMNKDEKVKAIAFLNEAGAMLITKSGDKIAKYFGISKYTLYSYLDANNDNV
ncbi:MAG: helix-turn-helix transcriptional regulator [Christensenellaceae bacterium]|jgi:predicted transcriptional regulator YheO|nr:helix-turn-helix transcriptional regulator [Christensenellaceae bacterium]